MTRVLLGYRDPLRRELARRRIAHLRDRSDDRAVVPGLCDRRRRAAAYGCRPSRRRRSFLRSPANPSDWELIAHNWEFESAILTTRLDPAPRLPADPARNPALHPTAGAGQRLSGRTWSARRGARSAVSERSGGAPGDAGGVAAEGAAQAQADHRSDLERGPRRFSISSMSAAGSTSSPRAPSSIRPSSNA